MGCKCLIVYVSLLVDAFLTIGHLMKVSTEVERAFLLNLGVPSYIFYNMFLSPSRPISFLDIKSTEACSISSLTLVTNDICFKLLEFATQAVVYDSSKWFVRHGPLKCRTISH